MTPTKSSARPKRAAKSKTLSAERSVTDPTKETPKPIPPASGRSSNGSHPTKYEPKSRGVSSGGSSNGAQPTNGKAEPAGSPSAAPTLKSIIHECDSDTDPIAIDDLTDRVIARLAKIGDEAWVLVRPYIRESVRGTRGGVTRYRESHVQQTFAPGDGTMPAALPVRELALDQLREFVGEQINVRLPNGKKETKLGEKVTIGEWNQRAHELEMVVAQAFSKVELYRSIATTLRGLGVDTIEEALTPERKRSGK